MQAQAVTGIGQGVQVVVIYSNLEHNILVINYVDVLDPVQPDAADWLLLCCRILCLGCKRR